MNVIRLDGCRADSLLGYLKALAVLRLVALQKSREVRGSWTGEAFELWAPFNRAELENFLIEDYTPLPVVNPWNRGAGFDGKRDTAAAIIEQVRKMRHSRWLPYRSTIGIIDRKVVANQLRDQMTKEALVQLLRSVYPDEALPWLDAAIVIGRDGAAFPYLLGSGGNDGRLDFSVNFAARAIDVVGDSPTPERLKLLRDALDDTSEAKLIADVAIGQFGPRYAGGVNGTTGFDAVSLVNPWDLVLAIEGSVAFCGGVAKRLPSASERVTFPFAFGVVSGGYTSASAEESARGELWLPIWSGKATFSAVSAMLRAGRADLPSAGDQPQLRTALNATQAAQAALTLGGSVGIDRFERIAFVQRNGLAYTACHSGTVVTANDPGIALLSRSAASWLERVRSRSGKLGKAARDALHRFDNALFDYARTSARVHDAHPRARARACAEVLTGLAAVDYAVAVRGHEELRPLEYLDSALFERLDDGSIEHRVALALVSLGHPPAVRERERELRLALEHVRYGDRGNLEYRPDARVSWSPSLVRTLGDICEQRVRAAESGATSWLRGSAGIFARDVAPLSAGDVDQGRLSQLLLAYSIVRPPRLSLGGGLSDSSGSEDKPAAAFALIKLVVDHPKACDRRIVALLRAREPARALALALQRVRTIDGLDAAPRSIANADIAAPEWFAAAVLVPIRLDVRNYGPILRASLTLSKRQLHAATDQYLKSIRTTDEE